jgi:hypothetical protein
MDDASGGEASGHQEKYGTGTEILVRLPIRRWMLVS